MKAFNFDDWFTKELNEQIASRRDALATANGIKDFADYQQIVGVLSGLTLALNTYKSLAKKQMEYDDE
jgi:hypothetical protein